MVTPPAVTLSKAFNVFNVTLPVASTDKYLVVCAPAVVADVRPKVRLLVEAVAPKILAPVLKVFIPRKACADVLITPLTVAEASGRFMVIVLVLGTADKLKSLVVPGLVPVISVTSLPVTLVIPFTKILLMVVSKLITETQYPFNLTIRF